ncbi:MAG: glycosyltransferase family 4 protein [Bacteroidetes bacterium]|nr:glycosyltransferase family 4 protein [Bacteroidota bacterium]MBS1740123.1 glycosyltransferase family 4 protein [Bacteroidota bacterium]
MPKSVLFIVPYPIHCAPSQRFRVELYETVLQKNGIQYRIAPFMDEATWAIIFKPGHSFAKLKGLVKGYGRRIAHLFDSLQYDYIFVHREATPLGPPVWEWIVTHLFRKKMIFDFDDAIWIPRITKGNGLARWFKNFGKTKYLCRWATLVSGGNNFLNQFAVQNGAQKTVFLPTVVDVIHKHNKVKKHHEGKPVVGWTGSHSTLFYLDAFMPILQTLQEQFDFTFLVIADKSPDLPLCDWQFIQWNEETEVADLLRMDIGIMPLKADKWSEGKCGFKLIQYMSCGIPSLADPVGVNKDIIDDGINGFLCTNTEQWSEKLSQLIQFPELRREMGEKGREKIVQSYSLQSQEEKFIALFN